MIYRNMKLKLIGKILKRLYAQWENNKILIPILVAHVLFYETSWI